MPGTMVGTIRKRNSVQRLGRNAMVISNRSFDIERKASRIWKVKAGSVVITMMNSTRNSMPWNQMMANTTQDSAGMPWKNVSTGAIKFSAVFDCPITNARMPPRMKAPNRPPKIRAAVSSTSTSSEPVIRISIVRDIISGTGGNR